MEKPSPYIVSRRQFLGAAAAFGAGFAAILLGCGDDAATGNPAATGDMVGEISGNHGHKAVLTKAQIQAADAVDLHIRNQADHDHTLSLSVDDMAKLKAGGMITVETGMSTDPANPHTHSVMFM